MNNFLRIVIIVGVAIIGWVLWAKPPSVMNQYQALKDKIVQPKTAQTTVYQAVGQSGTPQFSDQAGSAPNSKAMTVDQTKINRLDTAPPKSPAAEASGNDPLSSIKAENERFARQAADIKREQMDRVINQ